MELNQIKKYIIQNLYTGIIKSLLTIILSSIAIPLIIRNIGIEQYGVISIVLVFSSFTGILDLGLSKTLISFRTKERVNIKEISAIYLINLGIFSLLIGFSIIMYLFKINLLGTKIMMAPQVLRLTNSLAMLLLALGILNNLLRASLEADFKLQLVNWGFLIQSTIIHLGWLSLSLLHADISLFLFIPLISSGIAIIYHLILLPPIYFTLQMPDISSIRNVLGITFQFFKIGSLNSIHLPLMKYIIILFLGEGRMIGIFELSTKLAVLANNLMAYISNPFFSIAAKHQQRNKEHVRRLIKKVTRFLLMISISGYVVFLVLNKFLILYFFKEYSNEIFDVLHFVLIGYLFIAASESVQKYYLGIGEIELVARIKGIAIILNMCLVICLHSLNVLSLTSIATAYSLSLIFTGSFWLIRSQKSSIHYLSEGT